MSAIKIPEEFSVWVCYVTFATYCDFTHACIHVSYPRCFQTWCSWANCCWQVTSFPA